MTALDWVDWLNSWRACNKAWIAYHNFIFIFFILFFVEVVVVAREEVQKGGQFVDAIITSFFLFELGTDWQKEVGLDDMSKGKKNHATYIGARGVG